jgi:putative transposase
MIVEVICEPNSHKEVRMTRPLRLSVPAYPQHVIQRGNNRQPCFLEPGDYRFYLECLDEALGKYDVQLHAYVLMTNHVHLLMTPKLETSVARVMQSVGRRYVQRFNHRYERTGTLWEGRYRSSLVQDQHYLLTCYSYIELNPVRAGMVNDPGAYLWSSFGGNALGSPDPLIRPHPEYLSLGETDAERRGAYRRLTGTFIQSELLEAIRDSINGNRVLGSKPFQQEIESRFSRSIRKRQRGPAKAAG